MKLYLLILTLIGAALVPAPCSAAAPASLRHHLGTSKALALVFLGTDCPVANRYVPQFEQWKIDLQKGGATLVGVYSERGLKDGDMEKHARDFAISFPIQRDADGEIAKVLGVSRLATVVILDDIGLLRYRGRFDDGLSKEGIAQAKSHDARAAMSAVLLSQKVATTETEVSACTLSGNVGEVSVPVGSKIIPMGQKVTYYPDIAPILKRHCTECHASGGVAPFALQNYTQARRRAADIVEEVTEQRMPPWHAAPGKHPFLNERRLTEAEKTIIAKWLQGGALEGDPADATPASDPEPNEWSIGNPDEILTFERPEAIPPTAPPTGLPYRYVKLGKPFNRARWVRAAQVIPGDRSVVHHAIIHIVEPGQNPPMSGSGNKELSIKEKLMLRIMSAEEQGDLIAKDLHTEPSMLVVYVPGDDRFDYPANLGRKIPAGSQLIAEMHYTPGGKATNDGTRIGLVYHNNDPEREVKDWVAMALDMDIPPGKPDHRVRGMALR